MNKKAHFYVINAAVALTFAILVGCLNRSDVRFGKNTVDTPVNEYVRKDSIVIASDTLSNKNLAADKHTVMDSVFEMELKTVKKRYQKRFGRTFTIKDGYGAQSFSEKKKELLLLKYALKYDTPLSSSGVLQQLYNARYDSSFNKRVPMCKLDDNESSIPWPEYIASGDVCAQYLSWIAFHALFINKAPIPYDTVSVTKYEAWRAYYVYETGINGVPNWFREYSDKDMLLFYEHAYIRYCEYKIFDDYVPFRDTYGVRTEPMCNYYHVYHTYLSKQNEELIKIKLEKEITEHEEEFGRTMTELEKTKTEFEIQFAYRPIPICEKCTDEELLFALRIIMRMNSHKTPESINRDVARLLYQKYFSRKMSAAEIIVAEFEILFGKQITCLKCTDEELLMIWKYFGKRIDWDNMAKGIQEKYIPDTVGEDLVRSLKEKGAYNPCCLEPPDDLEE